MSKKPTEDYSEEEAQRRFMASLKAAVNTPHKTYEESKVRKRKPPAGKSPSRRKSANN
jgi:hypothetical protein